MDFASTFSINWVSSVVVIPTVGEDGLPGEDIYYTPGRVTFPLAVIAFAASFGSSFPHGYNTGVLNAPLHLIKSFLNESIYVRYGSVPSADTLNMVWSLTVAIYLVGGMAGAFSAGKMADKFGRKNALLFCHIFQVIAAVLFGCCKIAMSLEMLIIGRFVVGFGCGAGTGLVPMYLTEMAPINIRGAMGVLHQLALTVGILVSQILGLSQVLGNENGWPILLALTVAPCLPALIILPFYPDSPRFLYVNLKKEKKAKKALKLIRGPDHDISQDIAEMENDLRQQELDPNWHFGHLFTTKHLKWPLILVSCVSLCQQLSGINVVFYYSTEVFHKGGIPLEYTQYATLGTGVINVIMTIVSVLMVERSGRRPLLLGGMIGMFVSMLIITIALNLQSMFSWLSYVNIVCMLTVVVSFAVGLGSIPQFIGAELFKQGPRPPAMAFAGMLNWLANALVGLLFPTIQENLGAYCFLIFMGILVTFWIILFKKLPETQGKSFSEIEDKFKKEMEKDETDKDEEITTEDKIGFRLATYLDVPGHDPEERYALIRGHRPSIYPTANNNIGLRKLSVFSPDTRPSDESLASSVCIQECPEEMEDEC